MSEAKQKSHSQRTTRAPVVGAAVMLSGTITSTLFYALSQGDGLVPPSFVFTLLIATVISFLIFSACRRIWRNRSSVALVIGTLCSYLTFGALVLSLAAAGGERELAEAYMWMPVWILFGIPFMAPIVGSSWAGSILIFAATPQDDPCTQS